MLRLIEAEELKHILNNSKYYGTKSGNAFADMITECKTIEEPKKGKWVRDEFGSKCSCCGLYAYWGKFEEPWESNFCPNCGADMRGAKVKCGDEDTLQGGLMSAT